MIDRPPQPPSLGLTLIFLFLTALCVSASLAPLAFLLRPLRQRIVDRLPIVLRWLLLLPAAFLAGWVAEVVPRWPLMVLELLANRHLLIRSGVDFAIWQLFAPFVFVVGGLLMAPNRRFPTCVVLGGFKVVVAVISLTGGIQHLQGGGEWIDVDPITFSPIWWNMVVYALCIVTITSFTLLVWARTRSPRRSAAIAPVAKPDA